MTETLERPSVSTDDRLEQISAQVAELTSALHRQQAEREQLTELLGEVNLLARPVMDVAMTRFGEFDEKGYFAFAKESAGIVDHVVTSFSPEDVRALGDNVVTILQTVREMTQPEVMNLVRRTAETAQGTDEEITTPPSTFALLRQMRDPEVRRGLARVMSMLQTVGADVPSSHPTTTDPH
jgi:uncharacterized protein YjgD (DUF1641 family)